MVASAGLLAWSEHSERSVLPTGPSLKPIPQRIEICWEMEIGYLHRSYAGRVAPLQALFAESARAPDREAELDDRAIAAGLGSWLLRTGKLAVLASPLPGVLPKNHFSASINKGKAAWSKHLKSPAWFGRGH